jgi:hypothetical protein
MIGIKINKKRKISTDKEEVMKTITFEVVPCGKAGNARSITSKS